ncbi:hypothetical protein BGZ76_001491 [Entomortierella beljakovae]|nr:hypothetical protein BGZ76_001491 [Entomortierella beljakovae]
MPNKKYEPFGTPDKVSRTTDNTVYSTYLPMRASAIRHSERMEHCVADHEEGLSASQRLSPITNDNYVEQDKQVYLNNEAKQHHNHQPEVEQSNTHTESGSDNKTYYSAIGKDKIPGDDTDIEKPISHSVIGKPITVALRTRRKSNTPKPLYVLIYG